MHPLGETRTVVKRNHAFIGTDGHVPADLPGWTAAQGIIMISPRMMNTPEFVQMLVIMEAGGQSGQPADGVQRFVYVLEGEVDRDGEKMGVGDFLYVPADTPHTITSTTDSRLLIFEKSYTPPSVPSESPKLLQSHAWNGDGDPFLGDEDARMRVLLPTDMGWDMAVNLFTFQPGTPLPFVETHIMEHGLYLLEGQGVYRLDDCWYPIQAGDAIWMGAYCPQWFCAIGKTQSTYIYYKDVNRDPLGRKDEG